jgi:predicted ribosomally synthesized peptide with SipW-like signal peptide
MKRILLSLLVMGIAGASAMSATSAYFTDTETSTGNTFVAGTTDLTIDGGNVNVVKFNVGNVVPNQTQANGTWRLKNVGTINGLLDFSSIVVTNAGGTLTDAEADVDPTNAGNLGGELHIRLMQDNNCNGWYEATDVILYQGAPDGLPSDMDSNIALNVGQEVCINALVNAWAANMTNASQGDTMQLDMEFILNQFNNP